MLSAGVGRADMTPPVGIAHGGWGAAIHERAEGVHMPFYCTALYVTNGDLELVIVDLDAGIIPNDLDAAIRKEVEARVGIPSDNLRLSATHTHAGPGAYGNRFIEKLSMGHYDATVFDALVRTMTDTIVRAHEALAPVRIAYAASMTDGLVRNRVFDEGIVDPELL
ncbi:MAG: neutral/alkaline non-lysosomal ceramidase N-terminal domain-containing protein, partial [Chloroflexi bacterium]|nr:neutral/alkaline non-lysosomal ceramidase N-terminal domain-containing protein [Chloroflexota bacterium]